MRRQQRRALERKETKMSNDKIPSIGPGGIIPSAIKNIVGDDALREKKCLVEVNQILQRYDCVLVPKLVPQVAITAIPRGPLNG